MAAQQAGTPGKRVFEPGSREELLRGWLLHAHKGRDRHDEAARRYDRYRYWLGVPAIVFSAVVGTSVFASLGATIDASVKIIVGLISVTAAILSSLQTFFNFADLAERHRAAGVQYKNIIRELEQALAEPPESLQERTDWMSDLRRRLDELELGAPVVPKAIYDRIEQRYESVTFVPEAAQLTRPQPH
jgi:hypothetical protein